MQTVATKKLKRSELQTDVANMESVVCFVVTYNDQSGPVAEKMTLERVSLSYYCQLGQSRVSVTIVSKQYHRFCCCIECHHCVIIFDTKPVASYLRQQQTHDDIQYNSTAFHVIVLK